MGSAGDQRHDRGDRPGRCREPLCRCPRGQGSARGRDHAGCACARPGGPHGAALQDDRGAPLDQYRCPAVCARLLRRGRQQRCGPAAQPRHSTVSLMHLRGFTLIELVITLAIIALLTTAAMPLAKLVAQREKEAGVRTALRDIRHALDAYKTAAETGHLKLTVGTSGSPPDLTSLYECCEHSPDRTHLN